MRNILVLAFRNIATDKTSSNVENIVNNALETKLIRSRRKIYNTDHDANNNRKNNIGPQRDGKHTNFEESCNYAIHL